MAWLSPAERINLMAVPWEVCDVFARRGNLALTAGMLVERN
jgi:hypothetical protein